MARSIGAWIASRKSVSAWGTGLLAIEWLLGYVRRHTYGLFVVYRLVAAAIIVLLIVSGARAATF